MQLHIMDGILILLLSSARRAESVMSIQVPLILSPGPAGAAVLIGPNRSVKLKIRGFQGHDVAVSPIYLAD